MLHKTFDLLESKTDAQAGTFEATVAVFGNVDRGGDRIMPGAFKETLVKWADSGDPIPVILSHQWDNPMAHIGVVETAKETDKGLYVKGRLDVADNEVAKQVHRLMARRSLKEFSFGYEVPKGGEKRAKDGANELLKIDLAEVGPTLKGMNPATELHAVKSALEEKASPSSMAAQMRAMADEMASDNPPDPQEMAARMRRMADQMDGMGKSELQEVKARLAESEKALEDLRSKANVTEPENGSVDSLRNDSQRLALEIRSGGLSANPPKKQAVKAEVKPQPEFDPDELRKHSRDLMLQVLSGKVT